MLSLPWRLFPVSVSGGEFTILDKPLVVQERVNQSDVDAGSDGATGLIIWDGALCLAKFVEFALGKDGLRGKAVLELGAGTGLVGLSAALLGASKVVLTDLAYAQENLRCNVELNCHSFPAGTTVLCDELDWLRADTYACGKFQNPSIVLLADVVWLEPLVRPLVATLARIASCCAGEPCAFYMAHQTRSRNVEELFFDSMRAAGFVVLRIPLRQYHPAFASDKVMLFEMRLARSTGHAP
jgi:predicted nicotinamide N-methyase